MDSHLGWTETCRAALPTVSLLRSLAAGEAERAAGGGLLTLGKRRPRLDAREVATRLPHPVTCPSPDSTSSSGNLTASEMGCGEYHETKMDDHDLGVGFNQIPGSELAAAMSGTRQITGCRMRLLRHTVHPFLDCVFGFYSMWFSPAPPSSS